MDAKLITYTTEKLNKSEKSMLSKRLFGYTDKSNNSKYTYQRQGILHNIQHVKVCNNTFLIKSKDWPRIKKELIKRKASVKEWDIVINSF